MNAIAQNTKSAMNCLMKFVRDTEKFHSDPWCRAFLQQKWSKRRTSLRIRRKNPTEVVVHLVRCMRMMNASWKKKKTETKKKKEMMMTKKEMMRTTKEEEMRTTKKKNEMKTKKMKTKNKKETNNKK